MTITNVLDRVSQLTGTGAWDEIPIAWPFFENSDGTHSVKVLRTTIADNTLVTLTEDTDYTVQMDGDSPNTGKIVFDDVTPSTYRYTVLDNITLKQEVDLQNATIINVENIESALDKLTVITQNIQNEKFQRAIVLAEDTQVRNVSLASFADQASKIIRVNASEDGFDYVAVADIVSTSEFDISALTADATPDVAADYVATFDASANAQKKVLLSAFPISINARTAIDSIDVSADEILVYDYSAGTNKKATFSQAGFLTSGAMLYIAQKLHDA